MNRYDIEDPETWQAYVDDALDAEARARFEAAMAEDSALAARVAAALRVRDRVRAEFASTLDEPVPERFAASLATPAIADNVVPMPVKSRRWTNGALALAAAASLAIVIGGLWWRTSTAPVRGDGEARFAGGALARGLDRSLSSTPRTDAVTIGISFRDRDGRWCRSFAMPDDALAGLACRDGGRWRIETLQQAAGAQDGDEWRQASTPTAPEILDAIDARIDGDPLDAEQERAARDAGWR